MTSKREQILQATQQLIFEHGLQSISMSKIAREAGVGMGTIYNYFPTKEALINSLFSAINQALSAAILATPAADAAIEAQVKQFCRTVLVYGRAHPQALLLYEQLNHSPYILDAVQQEDYGMKAAFFQLMQAGQAAGVIKPLDAVLLGNLQVSYAAAIVRANLRNGIALDDALLDQTTDAWFDLLRQT